MNASQFTWWLHGYDEINGQKPDARQWQIIMDHLAILDEFKANNPPQNPAPPVSFCMTGSYTPSQNKAWEYQLSGAPVPVYRSVLMSG
jgi:hypothetical protein